MGLTPVSKGRRMTDGLDRRALGACLGIPILIPTLSPEGFWLRTIFVSRLNVRGFVLSPPQFLYFVFSSSHPKWRFTHCHYNHITWGQAVVFVLKASCLLQAFKDIMKGNPRWPPPRCIAIFVATCTTHEEDLIPASGFGHSSWQQFLLCHVCACVACVLCSCVGVGGAAALCAA